MALRRMKKTTESARKRRPIDNVSKKSLSQNLAMHEGIIQSLELMKIALHACLATLCFVRELLPDRVFSERQFRDLLPGETYTYNDFLREKRVPEKDSRKHKPIMMMERGTDDATDKILELLEEGIFDALVRRRLAAVQLGVTMDKERPGAVVETYTITMGSAGRYGNAVSLGAGLDCCNDEDMEIAVSIDEMDKDLNSMRRRLATLDEALEIPGDRALRVEIFYTDDCPETYRAHGFEDVDSNIDKDVLLFPVGQAAGPAWARISDLYGLINCGFHTAILRVSWLQCQCQPRDLSWGNSGLCIDGKRVALNPPLAFEVVVLRSSELGLPWADEANGGENSLHDSRTIV